MNRRVEMRTDMLADLESVPRSRGAAIIVAADLVYLQTRRVHERLGELDDWCSLVQGLG